MALSRTRAVAPALLWLALAFVCSLVCSFLAQTSPVPAQTASTASLRGSQTPEPAPLDAPDDPTADPFAQGDTGPDAGLGVPTPTPTPTAYPTLPPLQPYPGAQRLGLRGGPAAPGIDMTPAASVAAQEESERKKRYPPDDDPFAPAGFRLGDLRLNPYFEQDFGYSSNPAQSIQGAKGSALSQTEVGGAFQSDWTRNALLGDLRLGYTDYFNDRASNAPYGSGDISGRLDATRDLSFDAQGRFTLSEETVSSLGLSGGETIRSNSTPLQATYGATIGGTDRFGRFALALHGSIDRTVYEDATLSNGIVENLNTDDFTDYGVTLRGSYEASRALSPFLQGTFDTRRYDLMVDSGGYERNSNAFGASVGATLAFTKLITGELSVGYAERDYADPRFKPVTGPLLNGNLIWTPTALTTVTFRAQDALNDTTLAGASATLAHLYSLDVAHRLTRNFLVGAMGSYETEKYYGVLQTDNTSIFGLRAEYDLGRNVVLKATASRTVYVSTAPNSNYTANVFMLGLRLQP